MNAQHFDPVPRFDAPRAAPPVADRDAARTWPTDSAPAHPPRRSNAERDRYRSAVADAAARRYGARRRDGLPAPDDRREILAEVRHFLAELARADRELVSGRDVRHLAVYWDVTVREAFVIAADAASRRRINTDQFDDTDADAD